MLPQAVIPPNTVLFSLALSYLLVAPELLHYLVKFSYECPVSVICFRWENLLTLSTLGNSKATSLVVSSGGVGASNATPSSESYPCSFMMIVI